MANIRLTDRQWATQEVRYLAQSLNDLYAELMAHKRIDFPEWTDDSLSDLGNYILRLISVMEKFMVDYLNRIAKNCYIGTVIDRTDAQRILDLIGYRLTTASPASAVVTFTLESGHPEFTIPAGTKVGTEETPEQDQILFETSAAKLVAVGISSVDITCIQGETVANEVIGSSDGSADQRFRLSRIPGIYQSESVQVFSTSWQNWLRVEDFIDSAAGSMHYRVEVDPEGYYWIIFGDGVNGKVPVTGTNNIRCTYRVGGGPAGNVATDTIVDLISNVDYITAVNNAAPASGGAAEESLEHARKFGPARLRTLDRAVTLSDYKYLAENFKSTQHGGIAKARAISIALSVQLRIVPESGGLPAQGLKDELLAYLEARKEACTPLEVADPVFKEIDITMNLYVQDNCNRDTVVDNVRSVLANFLSPVYQDQNGLYPHEFGRDIYLSDVYKEIDSIEGVDHTDITLPAANVTIADHEIARLGDLNITAYQGGTQQSYLF